MNLSNEYHETVSKCTSKQNISEWNMIKNNMLQMHWITSYTEGVKYGNGLLYLIGNKNEIFAINPEKYLEVHLVDWQIESLKIDKINFDNYYKCLLITGFKLPPTDSPLWQHNFKPGIFSRGSLDDGNLRKVYEYINEEYGLNIWTGLTVHSTRGSWSSWPVHEFEANALFAPTKIYPEFKEQFAYLTDPDFMWGVQVQSSADGIRDVLLYKDGDIVNVCLGSHPSVAGPGTRLAYIWVYSGASKKEY